MGDGDSDETRIACYVLATFWVVSIIVCGLIKPRYGLYALLAPLMICGIVLVITVIAEALYMVLGDQDG